MRWSAVKAFAVKELKTTLRSREQLFWIVFWPMILVLMTGYIFIPPSVDQPKTLKIGVVNYDSGSTTPFNGSYFVQILDEVEYKGVKLFDVVEYENESTMLDDLKGGRVDGGFLIPRGFGANLMMGQATLKIYVGASDLQSAQINEAILRGFIEGMSREIAYRKVNETIYYMRKYGSQYMPENLTIPGFNETLVEFLEVWMIGLVEPINATFVDVKPETLMTRSTVIGWYTLGAAGMSILYTGLNIGSLMAVGEKERGTLKRLLASPATSTDMLIGKTLAGVLILSLTTGLSVIVGIFGCGAKILWNPLKPEHWLVPLLLVMSSLLMIGFGMLLSLVTKTAKGASGLSTVLGMMLSFTAGIWFPKSWMPEWMRFLGDVFPATWAIDAMRSIMVFEAGLAEVLPDAFKVLGAMVVVYLLGILAYRNVLRRYAEA